MADEEIRDAKPHVADAWERLWRAHASRDFHYSFGAILNDIPLVVRAPAPAGAPPTTTISTEDVRSNP
jgi:hypothetical protein